MSSRPSCFQFTRGSELQGTTSVSTSKKEAIIWTFGLLFCNAIHFLYIRMCLCTMECVYFQIARRPAFYMPEMNKPRRCFSPTRSSKSDKNKNASNTYSNIPSFGHHMDDARVVFSLMCGAPHTVYRQCIKSQLYYINYEIVFIPL